MLKPSLVVALVGLFGWVQAAYAVPQAGSRTDSRDQAYDVSGHHNPDVRRVDVVYDPDDNTLRVTVALWDALAYDGRWDSANLHLTIGSGFSSEGKCAAGIKGDISSFRGWAYSERNSGYWYTYTSGSGEVVGYTGRFDAFGALSADRKEVQWTTSGVTALANRDYKCVTNVYLDGNDARDEVEDFCLGDHTGTTWRGPSGGVWRWDGSAWTRNGVRKAPGSRFPDWPPGVVFPEPCNLRPPPPDEDPPTVSWKSPSDGQVISGVWRERPKSSSPDHDCRFDATDDVRIDHVDFYVDGQLLNVEYNWPYACVWDTTRWRDGEHTLTGIAYDTSGKTARASITVTVKNAGTPSLPPPPPPPPPPTSGNTTITGTGASNAITGTRGNDVIYALGGNDIIRGGGGRDIVFGGGGHDTVYGGLGNDLLRGGAGNDVLSGGRGNDRLVGGSGRDVLTGGPGRDLMYGLAGNDIFYALDFGFDVLFGGAGVDRARADAGDARVSIERRF